MKITFIMPAVGKKENTEYIKSWKMEPLAIATLAGLTPPDIETEFFDDRLETINYETDSNLIAINAETFTCKRAYEIASQFKKRQIPVIMGGFHPTLMPEEASEHADSVVVGEAEDVWENVILDLKNQKLQKFYKSIGQFDLKLIKPDRNIYNGKKYLPVSLVESARGCHFSCNFCSVSTFFKKSYKPRPIKDIVREIEALNRKTIFLVDDNINCNFERAKELFRALIPLKIKWFTQGSINIADDLELLKLMKKSGCLGLLIGFESLNKDNLLLMNKPWVNSGNKLTEALAKIRNFGLVVYGAFIIGYDEDDLSTFEKTVEFAIKQKFFLAAFNYLVPFPGTALYSKLENEGRLLFKKWWLEPNYKFGDIAFQPKKISPQELREGCIKTRAKFYNTSSIIKRALDFNTNAQNLTTAISFFTINKLSQKEAGQRYNLSIGSMN